MTYVTASPYVARTEITGVVLNEDGSHELSFTNYYYDHINTMTTSVTSPTLLNDQDAVAYAVDQHVMQPDKMEYRVFNRSGNSYGIEGFDRPEEETVQPFVLTAPEGTFAAGFDELGTEDRDAAVLTYLTSIGYVNPPGF